MDGETRPRRTKILYVEDDPSSVVLVRRVLESEGYQVIAAEDGLSAIEIAKREKPDLILMDINISGLDGYEVTTKIRNIPELSSIPIVAVTAATLKGDRERALIAGCDGYIPKPIDVDRFPYQVQAFLLGMKEEVESVEEKIEYLAEYSRKLVDRLEEKIRELEAAHAELQRIDKMKTDFVILASHELRTPLTAIYGYAQILLSNSDIPGSADEVGSPRFIIDKMAEATRRLGQVVGDIINVSLIDADKLDLATEPIFLDPLVRNVLRNITGMGPERKLTFEVEGLENLPVVMGDSQRLYQALWNVISNSIKYTPDGGRIRITGRQIEDTVHIAIQDTGVGIPPEERERIFDRFYVLEDTALHRSSKTAFKGGGLGLGLTVARGIIEAHGGKIWVESEGYDEERLPGSTFHVLLPLAEQ
ncbi:MAG TPA: hybrid sensor histidine kinase/response regulator [Thermoflexia bacterium]|nr:hybrid sensor histidine kinase/response regulator [Thermoflexia bacterium]